LWDSRANVPGDRELDKSDVLPIAMPFRRFCAMIHRLGGPGQQQIERWAAGTAGENTTAAAEC
jgi:hypothetical protein